MTILCISNGKTAMAPSILFSTCAKNALVRLAVEDMGGVWGRQRVILSPSNSFLGPKWDGMRFRLFGVTTTTREFTLMTISVLIRTDLRVLLTKLVYFLSIRKKTRVTKRFILCLIILSFSGDKRVWVKVHSHKTR